MGEVAFEQPAAPTDAIVVSKGRPVRRFAYFLAVVGRINPAICG